MRIFGIFSNKGKKPSPKANITSIIINYLGSTHQLAGKEVYDKEFEIKIPFRNKLSSELEDQDVKKPDLRIDEVEVRPPFKLVSVAPSLPIVLPYGSSTELTLKFEAPEISYSGPLFLNFITKPQEDIHVSISRVVLSSGSASYAVEESSRSIYLQKRGAFKQEIQARAVLKPNSVIREIRVNKPFELSKTMPELPITVPSSDSFIISLYLIAPEFNYAGPLEIELVT